ncbi:hypothetical protein JQC91_15830 [Jannaschia sp. Os4]|uniref:hypothetical protein n=1 Tax=Jannaschia sp. Os4 TaxID=2807617 RepID=UPI00193A3430|nr:hypothetical protein [Jannaschia sp. Os4]MBM2577777.1 hypothetical protein [Jannaschia sp. Os4]
MRATSALALLLATTAGASAQDAPACGGLGAEGAWIGGGADASDVATAQAPLTLDVTVPVAGRAVALLRLSEPAGIRVEAASADGDPYLALYDAEGAEVAADDDSAGNLDARAEADLPAGDYCLVARSYAAAPLAVTLAAGTVDQPPLAPARDDAADAAVADAAADVADSAPDGTDYAAGCAAGAPRLPFGESPVDAAALATGLEIPTTVATGPVFGFTLSESVPLTATARSEAGDPVLGLYRADGTLIAENDDFDGLNSRVDTPDALPAGDYCLALRDLNGDTNPIAVGLTRFDPAADRLRRIGEAEFPPLPSDAVEIEDLGPLDSELLTEVRSASTAEWLAFDVPAGGVLIVEAVAGRDGLDPAVRLFDRLGRLVAENDDRPDGGLDSLLVTRILPGRYTMAVRLVGDGATGPVRVLFERYVPAR